MQNVPPPQYPTMDNPGSPLTPAKARLSDDQKKKNHIDSEKKRREAIRKGFDKLTEIVPGTEGQARSEAVVLQATVEFMRQRVAEKDAVVRLAESRGWSRDQVMAVYQKAEKDFKRKEAEDEARANAAANAATVGGLPLPVGPANDMNQSQDMPQRRSSTPRGKSKSRSRSGSLGRD